MNKLANMIDGFNKNSARNISGSLPTPSNAGLLFGNSQAISLNSAKKQSSQLVSTSTANMVFIPIQGSPGTHHTQSTFIQHLFGSSDDDDDKMQIQQEQHHEESRNKTHHRQSNQRKQNLNVMQHHQDSSEELHQQSILFKKLTESGQIVELKESLSEGSETSGGQMLAIPLNLNDQNTLFSIVNQMYNSNIENTPNINNKCKCDFRHFANYRTKCIYLFFSNSIQSLQVC